VTKLRFTPGGEYDLVTPADLDKQLGSMSDRLVHNLVREEARGVKYIRLRALGSVSQTGILDCGGPKPGFAWSVRRISVITTFNGTADLYRSTDVTSVNAQGFIQEITVPSATFVGTWLFSSDAFILMPDEHAVITSLQSNLGSSTANGGAIEVPVEMLGKLLL